MPSSFSREIFSKRSKCDIATPLNAPRSTECSVTLLVKWMLIYISSGQFKNNHLSKVVYQLVFINAIVDIHREYFRTPRQLKVRHVISIIEVEVAVRKQ